MWKDSNPGTVRSGSCLLGVSSSSSWRVSFFDIISGCLVTKGINTGDSRDKG